MRTRSKNTLVVVALLVLLAAALSGDAVAARRRAMVAPDLVRSGAEAVRVIVTYGATVQDSELPGLLGRNTQMHRNLRGIHAVSGTIPASEIDRLADDPRILTISPDRKVASTMDVAVPTIGADHVTGVLKYTGRGVTVAVVDSGISASAAIPASRILASVNFTSEAASRGDAFGHGTHVAGTIGGSGSEGSVRGVAPSSSKMTSGIDA